MSQTCVYVLFCIHMHTFMRFLHFESVCVVTGGGVGGGFVVCYLMSLRQGPTQIISRVLAVYSLLLCPDLNCGANCRHTSHSPQM